MKCDRCGLDKSSDSFKSVNSNKHNILKTCIDCRNQISTNNKRKKNENRNKIIRTNQENAIAPENLVDFIFNALLEDYNPDYLFEQKVFIILDPLLHIVDTNLEDQVDKEVAQHIIKLISKADKFSW
ncbi:12900_t:CDS:1, partial [Ambispora leptoticha]